MKTIVVKPHRITGKCNLHKMGDQIVFLKGKDRMLCLDLEKTTCRKICMHALSMLFPYLFAEKTWASAPGPDYYHCPDPGPDCKGKGSVVFQVERPEKKSHEEGSAAQPQPNSKHEIRNSKQIRMAEVQMIKTR